MTTKQTYEDLQAEALELSFKVQDNKNRMAEFLNKELSPLIISHFKETLVKYVNGDTTLIKFYSWVGDVTQSSRYKDLIYVHPVSYNAPAIEINFSKENSIYVRINKDQADVHAFYADEPLCTVKISEFLEQEKL